MSRGLLPDFELQQIDNILEPVDTIHKRALNLNPVMISTVYPHESDVPIAAVCFRDTTEVLCECRMALHECYAHGIYYRQYKSPPNELTAIFMEQFFLSDLALRLYAAGEHLANAIIFTFELTDGDLKDFKKDRTSKQSIVGHYLIENRPTCSISKTIHRLSTSKDWRLAMDYRNKWVHEQPLSVEGLGIWYKRKPRWETDRVTGTKSMGLGGGDEPDYSIVKVREFLEKGFTNMARTTSECIRHFERELQSKGLQW